MIILDKLFVSLRRLYEKEFFSIYSVAYFVFIWLSLGNMISAFYNAGIPVFMDQLNITYLIIYISAVILIFISLYKEISRLSSKYIKIIITFQYFLLLTFTYAPPRNADSMRVWLAKIYDIILNNEKILRPYAHYNTPDAFTLFHLPLIQIGDGQLFQLSIFACFSATLILLIKICNYYDKEYVTYSCLLLFIFNPFITLGATVIISDMPVILSFAGIMYSIILFTKYKTRALLLSFLFLAFSLNIKYNSLMIIPAYSFWILMNYKQIYKKIDINFILLFVYLFSHGVYPYIMNYFYFGNPVWPALTNVFPADIPSWDIAANNLTHGFLNDERSFSNLIISFFNLLTMPHHINPIVILLIPLLFQRFKYVSYMPIIIVFSYFMFLWMMMPRFGESEKERYVLYLFPIIIPYGIIGFSQLINKFKYIFKTKILYTIIIVPTMIYFSFNVFYAKDSIQYFVFNNKDVWHKHTWYYADYNWINKNLSLNNDEKLMVYSSNQLTYYLKKKYISIAPISGYFKDDKIYESTLNFENEMEKFNVRYIFVDITSIDVRNKKMISQLVSQGSLTVLRNANSFISSSRLFDRGSFHKTVLYKVNT